MTVNDYSIGCKILIAIFFLIPIEGFCLNFSIGVPSSTGFESHVGVLEIKLKSNQIDFIYEPSQSACHLPDKKTFSCPFYNHLEHTSLPTIRISLAFDPVSLVTCSYSAYYCWLGFGDYFLNTKILDGTGNTRQCLFSINNQDTFNITCYPLTNLWVLINDIIENQATNIDKFAERKVSDVILLHNSDPRISENFKIASVYPESFKEIVINFHPNEHGNSYSIKIIVDSSRTGTGLDKIVTMEIVRNGETKITIVQNSRSTEHPDSKIASQHTGWSGYPPMPPGGGGSSVRLGFQEGKEKGLVEMMEQ